MRKPDTPDTPPNRFVDYWAFAQKVLRVVLLPRKTRRKPTERAAS
jgi:hypothetical protein